MEIVAKSDFIRISPRKLSLLARSIRGLRAVFALEILKSLNKKAAQPLILTLKQGIGNAVNNFKLDEESLVIKRLEVGKGPVLKRGRPVSRGQWHGILKRTSNLRIFLEGEEKLPVGKQEHLPGKKERKGAKNGAKG